MDYYRDFNIQFKKGTAIAIGKFDGFHLGHQKLIESVKNFANANDLTSVVLSFYPHPVEILRGVENYKTLFTQYEKKNILEQTGIDAYIEYPFSKEFSQIDPTCFIEDIVFKQLGCKYLAVGSDYRFGRAQAGTDELLLRLAKQHGVTVDIIDNIEFRGEKISSTLLKKYIMQNDFGTMEQIMSKPFYLLGVVADGKKIGRTIGFPTVNIIPDKRKLLPSDGVYITKTYVEGKCFNSLTNIGTNPTVNGETRTVETYLFGFEATIYGAEIKVEFISWLRDVIKFRTIEELQSQIQTDMEVAKSFIN